MYTDSFPASQTMYRVGMPYDFNQSAPVPPRTYSVANHDAAPMNHTKPTTNKVNWSPAVRHYVQRCFMPDNMVEGISREQMEAKLKDVITQAAESNNLDSVDWDHLPLPQKMLQEERLHAASHSPALKSTPPQGPITPRFGRMSLTKSEVSKKRKSSEPADSTENERSYTPPVAGVKNVFEDRISFAPASTPQPAEKRQRLDHHLKGTGKLQTHLDSRKKRFANSRLGHQPAHYEDTSKSSEAPANPDAGPVIGRAEKLEKNYFRLTAAPNPDTVRPLSVLRKTLDLLKRKWKQDCNYTYICDQFKSLRQDLTVQHIKNEFTVNVYEIHARIALEKGDLGEYNQCQTQLRALYRQHLGGHPMEFKAYRILYFIHTCNRTDMNDVLSELTPADKADNAVKHALDVRSALALGNYHRFFQLFLDTPNMGAYLMDMFVARERLAALACICKTYGQEFSLPLLDAFANRL